MTILRRFRDTITGRYTTATDAEARPAQTVGETPDYLRQELVLLRTGMLAGNLSTDEFFRLLDAYLTVDHDG